MTLPITDGLVAAYDFKQGGDPGTLYDISGNGHHGTIYGATWTGEGLSFDGTDDYVNIGDIGSLATGYTIFAAVKSNAETHQNIIGRSSGGGDATNNAGFDLRKVGGWTGVWALRQYDGVGPTYGKDAFDRAQIGDWYVLSGKFNGSTISLGHDGRSTNLDWAPVAVAPTLKEHTGDYYVGRAAFGSSRFLDGSVAYIAVYNRSLSEEEVREVYTAICEELAEREVSIPHRPIKPMIVVSLDDGGETDYTNAYRLAKERGVPVTSYIFPARIGNSGYLTWDQIREMRAAGFGIECHSNNHEKLTDLSEAGIRTNLQAVDGAFTAAGLPHPEHISYPFGAYDSTVIDAVSDYRTTGRAVSNGIEVIKWWDQNTSWYELKAPAFNIPTEGDTSEVKARIDDAIAKQYVSMIFTHGVSEDPGPNDCDINHFEEVLDYIAAKRDAGEIEVVTIDGLYRAMQGVRSLPATGPMTLHGETTGATYNKTVDYVGFVWGTTRHNNPEGAAPDASGYDSHWIAPAGDYPESKFAHAPELAVGTYYYRAAAEVDGAWVYGEELTLTVAEPSSLPNLYPAKLGSPYTILTAPYTTGDVLMTVHDADKLETSPNVVCLSGSVAGEFSYTGRYGNTLTGVTALPGTPQATWGVGTFAFRGIAAYDLNALVETVERLKEQIAALQTLGE